MYLIRSLTTRVLLFVLVAAGCGGKAEIGENKKVSGAVPNNNHSKGNAASVQPLLGSDGQPHD